MVLLGWYCSGSKVGSGHWLYGGVGRIGRASGGRPGLSLGPQVTQLYHRPTIFLHATLHYVTLQVTQLYHRPTIFLHYITLRCRSPNYTIVPPSSCLYYYISLLPICLHFSPFTHVQPAITLRSNYWNSCSLGPLEIKAFTYHLAQ